MKPIIQIIVCENSTNQNGRSIIENPYSLISFPFMPTSATFKLSIIIARLEISKTHTFSITMYKKEDPTVLIFDSGESVMGPFEPPMEGLTRLENLNLEFSINNVAIRTVGDYEFKVVIDGESQVQLIGIDHVPEQQ